MKPGTRGTLRGRAVRWMARALELPLVGRLLARLALWRLARELRPLEPQESG